MCGLAGISLKAGTPDPAMIARLATAIAHRGPDGEGHHRRGTLALVQRRLAVIDLETGNQPLIAPTGEVLAANGEIYNYLELRQALAGVAWRTKSDCEPPLELYRRHGLGFADHLRGMYAIALDDPAADRLVLARDPFGIKPLYLAQTADGIAFASEAQALTRAGWVAPKLDLPVFAQVLDRQYVAGPVPPLLGIERVAPGATLSIENGVVVERRQRQSLPEGAPETIDATTALDRLEAALRDSVTVHCRSDVPYGLFLSGGIDSSLILSFMAEGGARVATWSAGFEGGDAADERAVARATAARFGADHHDVTIGAADFWRTLPAIAAAMDDPAADYACLPTYLLAEAARGQVTVVLSGEGGDELFAGYGRYRAAMRPRWLTWPRRRRGVLAAVGLDRLPATGLPAAPERAGWTRLQQAQGRDVQHWLPNDLLIKLDRCLMAHALEGRTPFLDPAVVAAGWRLPDALKIADGRGKAILRQLLHRRDLAHPAFARKQGFTVPVGAWIAERAGPLADLVARSPGIAEVARVDALPAVFAAAGRSKHASFAAWTLTFAALWLRRHLHGQTVAGDVFDMLATRV